MFTSVLRLLLLPLGLSLSYHISEIMKSNLDWRMVHTVGSNPHPHYSAFYGLSLPKPAVPSLDAAPLINVIYADTQKTIRR